LRKIEHGIYLTHDRIRHGSGANSLDSLSSPKIPASLKKTNSGKKIPSKVKTQAIVKSPVNTEPEVSSDEFMKEIATEIVNPFGP